MDDVEESVVAKSTGQQEEKDIALKDAALYNVLSSKKKMTKDESGYKEQEKSEEQETNNYNNQACIKCKFNLPDEKKCHIVEGEINNEYGISNFFSSKGDGMLPGDIVWDFIKKTGRKLEYEEGHVIGKGAEGYQCKDCKYYMYSDRCLLIKGNTFMPEMSCAFVVKIGNGTDL
jgi:RNA polymerase subunit RPABC4/transcription elongation factor Spt4